MAGVYHTQQGVSTPFVCGFYQIGPHFFSRVHNHRVSYWNRAWLRIRRFTEIFTISMTALLELLKDADPEMKAKLRLALLT